MLSATPPGHVLLSYQRPNLDSNQDQDLRTVLCCPLHHRDVCSIQSRRPAPFSVEPRRHKARARGVERASASFGGWLLSQEHTRVG